MSTCQYKKVCPEYNPDTCPEEWDLCDLADELYWSALRDSFRDSYGEPK